MEATSVHQAASGGKGQWVMRPWCVWLAVGLVTLGAALNAIYLFNHCPFDLSEDESHYWEWSRHLDYGYYSKPPGIAWVLWAAQHAGAALGLNGDGSGAALMPVLRLPAVFFGMLSGLLSLVLARRMFRDDRAALAVIALSAAVPMFAVGSLLITIDAPMYLCWAATVYCLWRAVEAASGQWSAVSGQSNTPSDHRPPTTDHCAWLYAAGVSAGIGMLFKPVLIALPLCALAAACVDRGGPLRRTFFSRHALGALMVMLASMIPVILWNAHHGWVMFLHIGTQGGLGAQAGATTRSALQKFLLDPLSRLGEFVGGQAGGLGGVLFVLLALAVWAAWKKWRAAGQGDPAAARWLFLLSFTVPLWGFYLLLSFFKGTEVNWPAASYFTGMVLLAGIFAEGWNAADPRHRRTWRSWGTGTIAWGVLLTAVVLNSHRAYALAAEKLQPLAGTPAYAKSAWNPRNWIWEKPLISKLRGMDARAQVVEVVRAAMAKETGSDPLIIGRRYGISSSLAFYLPGQPFVYCMMSNAGERQSQYDLWPGLNEKDASGKLVHAGQNAVVVANEPDAVTLELLKKSFARVEGPQRIPVEVSGVVVKDVTIYRAWGFQGMPTAGGGGLY